MNQSDYSLFKSLVRVRPLRRNYKEAHVPVTPEKEPRTQRVFERSKRPHIQNCSSPICSILVEACFDVYI